jgi:hypothetical protein
MIVWRSRTWLQPIRCSVTLWKELAARKFRLAARGKGKSGGYRIVTFYAAADVPVFLLDLFVKGEKVNLSKAERNELKGILATLADEWRSSAKAKIASLGTRVKA